MSLCPRVPASKMWIRCTVLTTPDGGSTECDFVGYEKCISEFQMLVGHTSVNQDLHFGEFCGLVTSVVAVWSSA